MLAQKADALRQVRRSVGIDRHHHRRRGLRRQHRTQIRHDQRGRTRPSIGHAMSVLHRRRAVAADGEVEPHGRGARNQLRRQQRSVRRHLVMEPPRRLPFAGGDDAEDEIRLQERLAAEEDDARIRIVRRAFGDGGHRRLERHLIRPVLTFKALMA